MERQFQEVEEMNDSGPSMTTRIDRDGPLVAAVRRGDPTTAEDLVAAYGDRAWRLATRITGSAQDAEEAVSAPRARDLDGLARRAVIVKSSRLMGAC